MCNSIKQAERRLVSNFNKYLFPYIFCHIQTNLVHSDINKNSSWPHTDLTFAKTKNITALRPHLISIISTTRYATAERVLKGPFIATQLNSTQLNSTAWTVDSVCRSWRNKQKHDWLGCTLFNWVSWVQLCRYKHPLRLTDVSITRHRRSSSN